MTPIEETPTIARELGELSIDEPMDERDEKRVAGILALLNLVEQDTSSARCLTTLPHGGSGNQKDWATDVFFQLKPEKIGRYGRTLMEQRLLEPNQIRPRYNLDFLQRQGEEQAIRLMSPTTAQGLYIHAVTMFLFWMDRRGIPDDYREVAA